MNSHSLPRFVTLCGRLSEGAAVIVSFTGCVVLTGWIFDIQTAKSLHPNWVAMKSNTAMAFVLIGVSLWLLQTKRAAHPACRIPAQGCAFAVALIGLLSLSEYLFGWNLGIDQLLSKEMPGAVLTTHLGRMAPNTAANFAIIGVGLLLIDVETRRGYRPTQFLILAEGIVSLLAFFGYLYGVSALKGISAYTPMALHTAVAFLAICIGMLLARPDRGLMSIFSSNGIGGLTVTRLLPVAIVIPLLLGWLRLKGEQAGLYDTEFGVTLTVTATICIIAAFVWWTARSLDRIDVERKRAQEGIRKLNVELEQKVVERTAQLEAANKLLQDEITEHGQAEEALQYKEELLKETGRIAKVGGWEFDPVTRKGTWTEEVAHIHEVDPDMETNAELGMSFYLGESRKKIEAALQEAIEHGKPYDLELEMVTPKGNHKWVRTIARPVVENGKVVRVRGSFQDITERKQAEEEREITMRLLALTNSTSDLHALMSQATLLLRDWSGCEAVGIRLRDGDDFPYFEHRGFPPEFVLAENGLCLRDVAGRPVRDSDGNPVLECMCGNVLCGRFDPAKPFFTARGSFWSNCTTELLARTTEADRQTRTRNRCNGQGYESVALIAIRTGTTVHGLLQFNDKRKNRFTAERITLLERLADHLANAVVSRRSQESLRQSEERYRSLFENMLNGWAYCRMLFDQGRPQDFIYLAVNSAFDTLTGLKNVVGKRASEVIPGIRETDPGLLEIYGRVALTGVPERFETYVEALGMWFAISAYSPSKEHFVAVFDVITERKRAEEELKKILADLERSNKELEQFAYVASHDLQEPLRMVASFTQLLGQRYSGKLDKDADDFIRYAVDGANRLQALINDLLSYSRVSTRGKPFEPTDCEAVLGRVHANLLAAIEETGALLTHDPLPTVPADETQMVQLFQNLVHNAIKFRRDEAPRIHVAAQREGDEWVFSVRDNGIGIDAQYFDRIFVIFQRLHGKEEYPGTGIGLAVCKRIVERHGGRLWVESQPGQGSVFYFTLPAKPMTGKTTAKGER